MSGYETATKIVDLLCETLTETDKFKSLQAEEKETLWQGVLTVKSAFIHDKLQSSIISDRNGEPAPLTEEEKTATTAALESLASQQNEHTDFYTDIAAKFNAIKSPTHDTIATLIHDLPWTDSATQHNLKAEINKTLLKVMSEK